LGEGNSHRENADPLLDERWGVTSKGEKFNEVRVLTLHVETNERREG